jgi:DNA modification methylase
MTVQILKGDCREVLGTLPAESVHCVVTSPPYWGLRDYGVSGQVGLEDSAADFVETMRAVFSDVRRVLRRDGTLWLNLGDSYAGGGNYRGINSENTLTSKQRSNRGATGVSQQLGALGKDAGCGPKNLVGIPWLVAFALRADGWLLRQDIIWSKPNPMPESVRDRCTKAHEYLFLLSKSERYYYDGEAVAEEGTGRSAGNAGHVKGAGKDDPFFRTREGFAAVADKEWTTRNKRSVWEVATQPFPDAHFATFPPALIEPCILAGCPKGGTVLDPFGGAGTTALVADRNGRDCILIELNPEYAEMAERRIRGDAGMFAEVSS